MTNLSTPKQKLIKQIYILLGNNVVDLDDHLTTEDVLTCIEIATDRYRQRAGNSQEENIAFLTLDTEKQEYTLPKEILEVREVFRRGISPVTSGQAGSQFDPFTIAYTNLYLLQAGAGGQGGLYNWELYNHYLETAGLLFGAKINFTFDHRTRKLRIVRTQRAPEDVLLWVFNSVPDEGLIQDIYAGPWIRSYAIAQAKILLGNAYEKFSTIAGPGGGVTLNGTALKAEGTAEMDKLELELRAYIDGSSPLGWIVG